MQPQTLFLPAAVLLATLCVATAHAAPTDWKPDPKLLSKLGPPVTVGQFTMCLPTGYAPVAPTPAILATRPNAAAAVVYASPDTHPGGGAAALGVAIVTISRNVTTPADVTEGLREAVQRVAAQRRRQGSSWMQSVTERGSVAGIPFARFHYSEIVPNAVGTRNVHGFVYVSVYRKTFATFFGVDEAAAAAQSLPLMEAAVLTLHPQAAKIPEK